MTNTIALGLSKYEDVKQNPLRLSFDQSISMRQKFHDLIPGGGHTYAKGDDQFPEFMAPYIIKGKGCKVWDIDGNEFIEYGMGLRSVGLGHAFEPVVKAATNQIKLGSNFGRPSTIELECAEEFLSMIDGAEMVKFCKNGSDALDGAVRLSRAYTGRDMIGICADHPFFSSHDWFIGSTAMNEGVSSAAKKNTLSFNYNNIESVTKLFSDYPDQIACIILEPQKYDEPKENFLHQLKELCYKQGTVLIFDEMITGFRFHKGGGQKKFGVVPDLSAWGKAMGNGFSVAALAGTSEIMQHGGIKHSQERVFLLSTTHGAETHSLAAAIATMKFYQQEDVIGRLYEQGDKLKKGISKAASDLGIQEHVKIIGPSCCSAYTTLDYSLNPSQAFRTLFLQETLKRGLMMPSTVVSYSHSDVDIETTVDKIYEALIVYRKALTEGIDKYLKGRAVKPVWRKYN